MNLVRVTASVFMLALVAACAYPVTTVEQGSRSAAVFFVGAPVGAQVSIDGLGAGDASTFDGKKAVLAVPPGRRRVLVVSGGATLIDREIYVGQGSRVQVQVK